MEDCVELICNSGNGTKTTKQFSFHLVNVNVPRETLINKVTIIGHAILAENKNHTVYIVIRKTKVEISLTKRNFGNRHCSFNREI